MNKYDPLFSCRSPKRPDWRKPMPWLSPAEVEAIVDRVLAPIRDALRGASA